MKRSSWGCVLGVLLTYLPVGFASEKVTAPDLSKISDAKSWKTINAISDASFDGGKPVLRMQPKGQAKTPSDIAMALVEGLEFTEGTLEIDLKGKGPREASFLGLAFNVVDGKTFEAVYFRPFNFMREGMNDGQTYRSHAVQYVAWPITLGRNFGRGSREFMSPLSIPSLTQVNGFTLALK